MCLKVTPKTHNTNILFAKFLNADYFQPVQKAGREFCRKYELLKHSDFD